VASTENDQFLVLVRPLKSGASPPLPTGETETADPDWEWAWVPYAVEQAGGTLDGQTVTEGRYGWAVNVTIGAEGLRQLTLLLAEQTVGEPLTLCVRLPTHTPRPAKGGSG
jgi:hypothetical protein